jgi:hypothetical protein
MRVIASPEAVELIQERGGRLYVWATTERCCRGGHARLETATEAGVGRAFRPVRADGFDLYLAPVGRTLDELHLEVRGRRKKRVEAYPDGCAWLV